ncbi:MAG TPA: NAD(P)/FAD-dependent oxidoreductase [Fibrobacteria bacterium]|nr:NAD(P)/FAD-dependent oxidoreductase [Fibrobacteria bacterium]
MAHDPDVAILGAGPSGSLAAALLHKRGLHVAVYERETFPRFSIGESLLPQTMEILEEAGLLRPVVEAGFQYKNGAAFRRGDRSAEFDFRQKSSQGWSTTYQVVRAEFDKVLIDAVAARGVPVHYRHEVTSVETGPQGGRLAVKSPEGGLEVNARFILDATGFGRLLPRLLKLETPSGFPVRMALFTHIRDGIPAGGMDRHKILISVHPRDKAVWYWLIPFSNGRCSIGVVAEPRLLEHAQRGLPPGGGGTALLESLKALVAETPTLDGLLKDAVWDTPARSLKGYAANVNALHGPSFALLGNAGEFLDPVFSSGVTIAMRSASLIAPLVDRHLSGGAVDWAREYDVPLRQGVDAFRAFVDSWYRGGFQDVIFHPGRQPQVKAMICSILAGYAWDRSNPYVADPARLKVLEELCAPSEAS